MKKLLALLSVLLAAPLAFAITAYSPPVGGAQITIAPGTQFVGMPLANQAVAYGLVSGNTSTVLTLNNASNNVGALLSASTTYYVELTAGPDSLFVGDRFEVDVATTIANANNTLAIVAGSNANTLSSLPTGSLLNGYTVTVRPHVTLGQLFGTFSNQLMHGATVTSAADQVLFFNSQSQAFQTYYFLRNASGTVAQWTLVGGGSTNRDSTTIPPGVGVGVIRNTSGSVTLTWMGEVRRNAFVMPLVVGYNLVSQPLPINSTPVQNLLTYANGFTGATVASSADQIEVFTSGAFQTYYLLRNASGSIEQWTLIGGGSTNHNNTTLLNGFGSVLLKRTTPAPDYTVPYNLSL